MTNAQNITSAAYVVAPNRREGARLSVLKGIINFMYPVNLFSRRKNIALMKQTAAQQQEIESLKWELLQRSEQLKNITYYQSHMVRRPLANILGITELIVADNANKNNTEMAELVSLLRISADELDRAIKNNAKGI